MKHYLLVFCTCLFLVLGCDSSYAQDYSPEQTGTVTISPSYNGENIFGGNILVYQIAKKNKQAENEDYIINQDFSKSDIKLDKESLNKNNRTYANSLLDFVKTANIYASVEEIEKNGHKFENLEEGIYLFAQTKAADGFELMSPFIVTIPTDGKFNLSAVEKMSPKNKESDKNNKITPKKKEEDSKKKIDKKNLDKKDTKKENKNDDSIKKLPQTGQVWWPVYLLVFIGVFLIIISFIKFEKNNDKKTY